MVSSYEQWKKNLNRNFEALLLSYMLLCLSISCWLVCLFDCTFVFFVNNYICIKIKTCISYIEEIFSVTSSSRVLKVLTKIQSASLKFENWSTTWFSRNEYSDSESIPCTNDGRSVISSGESAGKRETVTSNFSGGIFSCISLAASHERCSRQCIHLMNVVVDNVFISWTL